jgi:UDP-glucose 4-epimerase
VRVLVTGGYGHVGAATLPELRRRGHEVRVLSPRLTATRRAARRHGIETLWGDITDRMVVDRAVAGVDAVIHLAAVLPPAADAHPERARATNVDGTATVIAACEAQPHPPRLLFTSSFNVHGDTRDRPPPVRADAPLVATNPYAEHKIAAEALVRASGLTWCIVRLADVPVLGLRRPPRIMFANNPDIRIETLHPHDAGLALATAVEAPEVWGRVLLLGGGPTCQLTYREYISRMLAAMGIDPLPDAAFSRESRYPTDWLDTAESQALLRYQRHSFEDIVQAVMARAGWRRTAARALAPLIRAALLRGAPSEALVQGVAEGAPSPGHGLERLVLGQPAQVVENVLGSLGLAGVAEQILASGRERGAGQVPPEAGARLDLPRRHVQWHVRAGDVVRGGSGRDVGLALDGRFLLPPVLGPPAGRCPLQMAFDAAFKVLVEAGRMLPALAHAVHATRDEMSETWQITTSSAERSSGFRRFIGDYERAAPVSGSTAGVFVVDLLRGCATVSAVAVSAASSTGRAADS